MESRPAGMIRDAAVALARAGTLPVMVTMNRHARGFYTVEFLSAALASGLLKSIADRPRDLRSLADDLDVDPGLRDGLAAFLDLGVALRVLSRRGQTYRVRRCARALLDPDHDAIAAFYLELAHVHHPLIAQTPARLREGRPFDIADADPALIARSSRFSEPYIEAALRHVVPPHGQVRIVEVGCGSGAHLRTAASLNPELRGLGIELQGQAAEQAHANLRRWGLDSRFAVQVGDIRDLQGSADADLVTLHQNIYYFPVPERVELLAHVRGLLRPGGKLLVTSICRHPTHAAATLDLWGAMTRGTGRLPVRAELSRQIVAAGYADVRDERVTPDGMFCAFIGTNPG